MCPVPRGKCVQFDFKHENVVTIDVVIKVHQVSLAIPSWCLTYLNFNHHLLRLQHIRELLFSLPEDNIEKQNKNLWVTNNFRNLCDTRRKERERYLRHPSKYKTGNGDTIKRTKASKENWLKNRCPSKNDRSYQSKGQPSAEDIKREQQKSQFLKKAMSTHTWPLLY